MHVVWKMVREAWGMRRELTSSEVNGERAEITYDPAHPATAQVGSGTTGWLVFGAVRILRGHGPAGV